MKLEPLLKRVIERLVTGYSPDKVILFGSCLSGELTPDSDIDLLIIKRTTKRFIDRWVEAQTALNGSHSSIPVETIVLTPEEMNGRLQACDHFIRDIVEKGRVLYAA